MDQRRKHTNWGCNNNSSRRANASPQELNQLYLKRDILCDQRDKLQANWRRDQHYHRKMEKINNQISELLYEFFRGRKQVDMHRIYCQQAKQLLKKFVKEAIEAHQNSLEIITGLGRGVLYQALLAEVKVKWPLANISESSKQDGFTINFRPYYRWNSRWFRSFLKRLHPRLQIALAIFQS